METASIAFNLLTLVRIVLGDDNSKIIEADISSNSSTSSVSKPLPLIAEESNSFWIFNESADVSKYENFDQSKFIETEVNKYPPIPVVPTTVSRKQSTASSNRNKIQTTNTRVKNADSEQRGDELLPFFENNIVTNITTQQGSIAILPCKVRNLGDRSVTWIRRRDWHIITSGILTYTTDDRYQVIHKEDSEHWDLKIKYATKRDNGTYECQVPHKQGKISQLYNLHVLVPSAFILGSHEYHVGVGSTISLVCIIENSPIPPQYVLWFHNENMMNYESSRASVLTVTNETGKRTHSKLIINDATPKDSGNYTCRSSNAEPDTTYVYVSHEGDNTAAIQRPSSSIIIFPSIPIYFVFWFAITLSTVF